MWVIGDRLEKAVEMASARKQCIALFFCFVLPFFFFSEGLGKGILRGKTAATKHRWGRFPGQMVAQVNEVLASSHNHIIITNKLGTMVIQNHLNSS